MRRLRQALIGGGILLSVLGCQASEEKVVNLAALQGASGKLLDEGRALDGRERTAWLDRIAASDAQTVVGILHRLSSNDRWFLPALGRLIERRDVANVAARVLCDEFRQDALAVSRHLLRARDNPTSRTVARELALRDMGDDPDVQGVFEDICRQYSEMKWGILFDGSPRGNSPRVMYVCRDGRAARAGLRSGDFVLRINGEDATAGEITDLLGGLGSATLSIRRGATEVRIELR